MLPEMSKRDTGLVKGGVRSLCLKVSRAKKITEGVRSELSYMK